MGYPWNLHTLARSPARSVAYFVCLKLNIVVVLDSCGSPQSCHKYDYMLKVKTKTQNRRWLCVCVRAFRLLCMFDFSLCIILHCIYHLWVYLKAFNVFIITSQNAKAPTETAFHNYSTLKILNIQTEGERERHKHIPMKSQASSTEQCHDLEHKLHSAKSGGPKWGERKSSSAYTNACIAETMILY